MLKQRLEDLLAQTELSVTEQQVAQLVQLVELLAKWNKAYNLTSVRDPQEMLVKHILDSLVVSPHLPDGALIDVGTGPGLPGLPLAIINPDKQFTLLDSLGKRISFIRQVVHALDLKNVTPVLSRVEEFQGKQFDGVLSRAFASISDMLNWCSHLPAKGGKFYALKGQLHQHELDQLDEGYIVDKLHSLVVPELEGERHLVIINKLSEGQ
ncbi:16S rRNA (guanine(527)-N(7))-methyltransferase RsmG [Aliagarivorans marinus]|uniref:16S rRNA (guanine(527)-N(7))-methyltransferase RsmG n=1 Tax=Aliagarivorans marinus TaxID=561965 RepID=UPI00040E296F|nr:16S rRNA (guanine(527)-N(7))-methyltransferase RsmG [Aliagarivorans marinus]